jgi:hypothetical protein
MTAMAGRLSGPGGGVEELARKSDAWTDLGLTLPIFLVYHLGVVFLPVRNAVDPVTTELGALAQQSLPLYFGLTLAVGAAFVVVLLSLGQRKSLQASRFAMIAFEGALYAFLMRAVGSYVVGSLRLEHALANAPPTFGDPAPGLFGNVVMALGAGFYEEVAFRALLFGAGSLVLRKVFGTGARGVALVVAWAVVSALVFSAWHYVGAMGDGFELKSFLFRAVCGLVLTLIYAFRGLAPAVWTHAIYDVWVMAF